MTERPDWYTLSSTFIYQASELRGRKRAAYWQVKHSMGVSRDSIHCLICTRREREKKRQMFSLCVASCFNCNLPYYTTLSGGQGISDLCPSLSLSWSSEKIKCIDRHWVTMPSRPVDIFCISDDDSSGRAVKKLPRKPQVKKKELQVSYKVSASTSNNTLAVSTFAHTGPVGNVNSRKRRSVTQVTTQIAQGKWRGKEREREVK